MYKNLYDNFKHWYHYDTGTVYFYSDPHFNDEEMKYLRSNYIGDMEQVARINSKVGRCDTIVFLGDIGDVDFIRYIRGYKVLIMGNHDAGAANYKRKTVLIGTVEEYKDKLRQKGYYESVGYVWYDNELFDEVYEGVLTIAPNIILSHEPIGDFPYAINIHGHTHNSNDKYNMCAENINYTPVPIKRFIEDGISKKVVNIHRETIDKATERKRKRK